ncbi:hypothetical protein FRB95_005083 [Tulasnella sp. JGI-2019a]|nr:hypothetical protein FRB95_005083 [Tulasnella sp. JGI-2019a]
MLLATVVFAVAAFVATPPFVHAGWINARDPLPSSTTSECTASCPSADQAGYSLGPTADDAGNIYCAYPRPVGEARIDHFCVYDEVTGVQRADIDGGLCFGSAPLTTCTSPTSRKREHVPAKPQPAAVPVNMRSFAGLKKSKLATRGKPSTKQETK